MGSAVHYCARCSERIILKTGDPPPSRDLQNQILCGSCSSGSMPAVLEDPRPGSGGRHPSVDPSDSADASAAARTPEEAGRSQEERLKALRKRALRLRRR